MIFNLSLLPSSLQTRRQYTVFFTDEGGRGNHLWISVLVFQARWQKKRKKNGTLILKRGNGPCVEIQIGEIYKLWVSVVC